MSATGSMATGWYMLKQGVIAAQQTGPYTWEQLYELTRTGTLQPGDLVWNAQMPSWLPAAQIPGLVAGAATPGEPAAASSPSQRTAPPAEPGTSPGPVYLTSPVPGQTPPSRPRKRKWLLPVLIPLVALIVVGGGLGAFFALHGAGKDGATASTVTTGPGATTVAGQTTTTGQNITMGKAEVKVPDSAKLIQTTSWGEVPANQIGVVLADGKKRADADKLAQTLGGAVVGEIEFINGYQIETKGTTEADLQAALAAAKSTAGVELAFPNGETTDDEEIWGVRQSPLNDPAYSGDLGKGYEMIGAQKAWTYMQGSGLHLWNVHVGVVDDGLFKGTGEFDGAVNVTFPDQAAGELKNRAKYTSSNKKVTVDNPAGSHGTKVSSMIGADAANGGVTGVASNLGHKLTISMINQRAGQYGTAPVANPDPNNPTVVTYSDGKSYSLGGMVAMTKQIEDGAKVINCSWGNKLQDPDEETSAAYKKFFTKMAAEHPDVLFVCSAGNDGVPRDGDKRYPSGFALSNMITVGNVMNDGTVATSSNRQSDNFEVTMAAPGDQAVVGVDANGKPITDTYDYGVGYGITGGTSMAAPQVAAAAALLLSMDPNLTAARLKEILSQSARPGPDELGGKTLAVDQAVLAVINDLRERQGLPAATPEELENAGVVDAVATSQEETNTYALKAILKAVPADGADVKVTATAGCEIDGETTQSITSPGDVVWAKLTVPGDTATVTVTRLDSGASSVISFEKIDINGKWAGTMTFTDITVDQEAAQSAQDQGCSLALLDALKGKPLPMTMDITVDESGQGEAVTLIDVSSLNTGDSGGSTSSEPQTWPLTYSGHGLVFQVPSSGGAVTSMTGTVAMEGKNCVIKGALSGSGKGYSFKGVWTVGRAQ